VVFLLLIIRQQNFASVSLILLGIGTALTGFFPSILGLYITTVIMSIGFHYLETLRSSLSLQWLSKEEAPRVLGKLLSVHSASTLVILSILYIAVFIFEPSYPWLYALAGFVTVIIGILCHFSFPQFSEKVEQRKDLVFRKRYWLYYALTFLSGARRQIFMVFAGFLLVQKFGFPLDKMVLLLLVNSGITAWVAPKMGILIEKIGERKALTLEYIALIIIFLGYAVVDNVNIAFLLYILDNIFYSISFAIKTYFQKIADPADIASTAGISFTINHIAAVLLPALLGLIWMENYGAVFLIGACIAGASLILVRAIPDNPEIGKETYWQV
ncbi:MAG: MFS transporter, partial [Candidatus Nitrosopelagicus sp.]|nr:MFS transporter [Candidatus Nitrosopelagicus sp.]